MKLYSDSFAHGQPIPPAFAIGRKAGATDTFSDNRNPHLAWSDVPAEALTYGTYSLHSQRQGA